jgi:hypothetical protein
VTIPRGAELVGSAGPDGSIIVTWEGPRRNAYGLSHPDGVLGPPIAVPTPIPLAVTAMDQEAAVLMLQWWPDFLWADHYFSADVDFPAAKATAALQAGSRKRTKG